MNFLSKHLEKLFVSAIVSILPSQTMPFMTVNTWLSFALSILTVCGGLIFFIIRWLLPDKVISWPNYLNPRVCFEKTLSGILRFGRWFTYISQNNTLTQQLRIILIFLIVLLLLSMISIQPSINIKLFLTGDASSMLVSLVIIGAALSLIWVKEFLNILISLSLLGLAISFFFVIQGAPDVAMTQILIEILTVVILVIALRKKILISPKETKQFHFLNAIIAITLSILLMILLLDTYDIPFQSQLSNFFISNSLPLGNGKNVVNVILVDFRSFDTLGEVIVIFSIAIAIAMFNIKKYFSKGQS